MSLMQAQRQGEVEQVPMSLNVIVTRGLDPRVHPLRKKMDCQLKPGNDEQSRGSARAVKTTAGAVETVAPLRH